MPSCFFPPKNLFLGAVIESISTVRLKDLLLPERTVSVSRFPRGLWKVLAFVWPDGSGRLADTEVSQAQAEPCRTPAVNSPPHRGLRSLPTDTFIFRFVFGPGGRTVGTAASHREEAEGRQDRGSDLWQAAGVVLGGGTGSCGLSWEPCQRPCTRAVNAAVQRGRGCSLPAWGGGVAPLRCSN